MVLVGLFSFEAFPAGDTVVPGLLPLSLLHLGLVLVSCSSLLENVSRDHCQVGDFPLEVVPMPVSFEVVSVEFSVMEFDLTGDAGECRHLSVKI